MTSSTFHISLPVPPHAHAPPPPTTNALDASQRTRLLRSTRKLEALLGTTPFLLDDPLPALSPLSPLLAPSSWSAAGGEKPAPSPRTKAYRREGRVFGSQSSESSSEEGEEEGYVVLRSGGPKGEYQHVVLPLPASFSSTSLIDDYSSSSSRGSSLDIKRKHDLPPIPIPSTHSHARSAAAAQPLIHRPIPPRLHRISLLLSPPTSPLSPSFASNSPSPSDEKREKERRKRKMNKLVRTLGENVPPELVFRGEAKAKPSASAKKMAKEPELELELEQVKPPVVVKEKTTLCNSTKRKHRPRSLTLTSISPPSSSTTIVSTSSNQKPKQTLQIQTKTTHIKSTSFDSARPLPSLPRPPHSFPASSTAAHSPSLAYITPRPLLGERQHSLAFASAGTREKATPTSTRTPTGTVMESGAQGQEWYRKEREWSGEWNVRDMGDVVMRLRGLKVR